MHRKLGALCAIGLTLLAATTARAQLRVEEPVADLGEIRGGPALRHDFTLVNAGKQAVEILEVNRGCGCVAPRLDKRVLQPGDKALLQMEIRTLGQQNGAHAWTAQIRYKDGDETRETALAVKAIVKNEVTVAPAVLALIVENKVREEITVTDSRPRPFTVSEVRCTAPAKLSIERIADGKFKVVMEVDAADLKVGRTEHVLSIYTSDPVYAHLETPITITRVQRSAVLITPGTVDIELARTRKTASALVRLRPRGDEALAVKTLTWGDGIAGCDWVKGPGNGVTLKVRADVASVEAKEPAKRTVQSFVRVELSEPAGQVVTVPVRIVRME